MNWFKSKIFIKISYISPRTITPVNILSIKLVDNWKVVARESPMLLVNISYGTYSMLSNAIKSIWKEKWAIGNKSRVF